MADNQFQNRVTSETSRAKVFVSYSRTDIDFALDVRSYLEDKKFEALLDQHAIDANDDWKSRLGQLIAQCDTVVFVLSDASAASPICKWEVEEATRLAKRMLIVAPRPADGITPPEQLAARQWIACYRDPKIEGSGFFAGLQKLERALKTDLEWLRQQTWLFERASEWMNGAFATESIADTSSMFLRGSVLIEANNWMTRAPAGAVIPAVIQNFLEASIAAEQQAQSEVQVRLEERARALEAAEAAAQDRSAALKAAEVSAQRLRSRTRLALIIAAIVIVLAIPLNFFAVFRTLEANDLRAAQYAEAANRLREEGKTGKAMTMALLGDPSANYAFLESVLRWYGNDSSRRALASAFLAEPQTAASPDDRAEMPMADADRQIEIACVSLARLNGAAFEDSDFRRFTFLMRDARHPCTGEWKKAGVAAPVSTIGG